MPWVVDTNDMEVVEIVNNNDMLQGDVGPFDNVEEAEEALDQLAVRNFGVEPEEDIVIIEPGVRPLDVFNWGEMAQRARFGINAIRGIQANNTDRRENGPEFWRFLLDNVREILECDAAIAGGAVRDYFLGLPPKDIDVFVDIDDFEIIQANHPELNWGPGFVAGNVYKDNERLNIKGVMNFQYKGHKIQLVAKPIPKEFYATELIKTFDMSVGMCYFTYDKQTDEYILFESDTARNDREKKQVTCMVPECSDKTSKRFDAWVRRNNLKDWKLIGHSKPKENEGQTNKTQFLHGYDLGQYF